MNREEEEISSEESTTELEGGSYCMYCHNCHTDDHDDKNCRENYYIISSKN
jgi:hypothetical protein